jgi:two-component system, chemotaxis family, protein-glutamate methylesterase/glutaminase
VGHRDIVVIGGSAGAIEALAAIIPTFSADLPATIFIVIHTAADSPGILPTFSHAGSAARPLCRGWSDFRSGAIYLAPPDFHLLLDSPNVMSVVRGPRENRTRPAVDPLFSARRWRSGHG